MRARREKIKTLVTMKIQHSALCVQDFKSIRRLEKRSKTNTLLQIFILALALLCIPICHLQERSILVQSRQKQR